MTRQDNHSAFASRVGLGVLMAIVLWMSVQVATRRPLDDGPAPRWPDARVDVNTAPAAELQILPGIGPNLADAIVEDRRQRGPFRSIDDLDRVYRIGANLVERVRPYAVAGAERSGPSESAEE
jgi:competence ComEA-like helix-hairpin-helix protein